MRLDPAAVLRYIRAKPASAKQRLDSCPTRTFHGCRCAWASAPHRDRKRPARMHLDQKVGARCRRLPIADARGFGRQIDLGASECLATEPDAQADRVRRPEAYGLEGIALTLVSLKRPDEIRMDRFEVSGLGADKFALSRRACGPRHDEQRKERSLHHSSPSSRARAARLIASSGPVNKNHNHSRSGSDSRRV